MAGQAYNEDAAVVHVPEGKAIIQSVDVLTPIVNDARNFGRIAAANALSDIYAMGGEPWCAMCLAFFPPLMAASNPDILITILEGGLEKMAEAGATLAGGHTVQDEELKFGLSVTGIIDPNLIARNDGLTPGQRLILTKPLGIGILATGVKANWDFAQASEAEITYWCSRLNKAGAEIIHEFQLTAATDITGFGLGGHAFEMAKASDVCVVLESAHLPLLPHTLDYARDGLIPAGTHANQKFYSKETFWPKDIDPALISIIFDAQTSGGLLLALPEEKVQNAKDMLIKRGDIAAEVGYVTQARLDGKKLVIEV